MIDLRTEVEVAERGCYVAALADAIEYNVGQDVDQRQVGVPDDAIIADCALSADAMHGHADAIGAGRAPRHIRAALLV